jgi:hypothetical protein
MTRYLFWLFAVTFFVATVSVLHCAYSGWIHYHIVQKIVHPIIK